MSSPASLFICIENEGAEDLQVLKVYRSLPDTLAESRGYVRVVDESGEDYLYPKTFFQELRVPNALAERLEELAVQRARG